MNQKETSKDFVARMLKQQKEIDAKKVDSSTEYSYLEKVEKEQKPLLEELAASGIYTESIGELLNSSKEYKDGIPILLKYLDFEFQYEDNYENLIRCLTVNYARGIANKKLIEKFDIESDSNMRWVIANALSVVADESDLPSLYSYIENKSLGHSRSCILEAIARIEKKQAVPLLLNSLNDNELLVAAATDLGKLKVLEAEQPIRDKLNHPDAWHRQKLKAALKKIEGERQKKDEA